MDSSEASAKAKRGKDVLGRAGLVGQGVLFAVIGVLGIQIGTGDAQAQADKGGAIQWVGSQPLGRFLLVALTASLFALGLWRILDAALGDPVEGDEATDRIKFLAVGLGYLVLAVGALSITVANWTGDTGAVPSAGVSGGTSDNRSEKATATVLEWPAGRWLVGLAGLALIIYGGYLFERHTIEHRFVRRLRVDARSWAARLGQVGYAARSAVGVAIGFFLVQAAIRYDPQQANGLSESLRRIGGNGWGQLSLWAIALGLFAYGLFCIAEAKYRRAA
jgi:hypothetical protein